MRRSRRRHIRFACSRLMHTLEEEDPVATFYRQLAPAYDLIYGVILHPAARGDRADAACTRHACAGSRRRHWPQRGDASARMRRARRRLLARDAGARGSAAGPPRHHERAPDGSACDGACASSRVDEFDVVYAPYLINVVSDPLSVAREMRRVCRPGGHVVFLNHFRGDNAVTGWIRPDARSAGDGEGRRPLESGDEAAAAGGLARAALGDERKRAAILVARGLPAAAGGLGTQAGK